MHYFLGKKRVKYSEDYKIKELKFTFQTLLERIPFHHKLEQRNKESGIHPSLGLTWCDSSIARTCDQC